MRIVIEPSRFRRLLENVLLYHGGADLDSALGEFSPKKVDFKDDNLEVIGLYGAYSKAFFLEYEAGEDEKIPFSKSLLEQMRLGFGGDDKQMTVRADDAKIYLEGTKERYEEPLIEMEPSSFAEEFGFKVDKALGLVPGNLEAEIQVLLKTEALTGLPKAKDYLFRSDGKDLEVIIEDVGKYTRQITPSKVGVMKETELKFEAGYFAKVANQFDGEVWLTLRENAAVFSQKSKDHMKTYVLSSV